MTTETLAQQLYETYCKAAGGKAANGADFTTWSALIADPASKIPANWRAVAETVVPKTEVITMTAFIDTTMVDVLNKVAARLLNLLPTPNTTPTTEPEASVADNVFASPPARKGRSTGSKNAPADV